MANRKDESLQPQQRYDGKPSDLFVVERRRFGIRRTVITYPASRYFARISTSGVLCIHKRSSPNELYESYAAGEWHRLQATNTQDL